MAQMVINNYSDDIHQEQYRGHDSRFWRDIQVIHDIAGHWNGKDLTALGLEFVNTLREKYK
mgnify:CR=1 FL=1